ncbi:hypothetical protein GBL_0673 [Geobacillus kaustophilus GBlys]|uniref:Uncharacterized protein n=1 Tax=Geobacillus kaustophilus GBlys TaxID=1337888 RepID=U2WNX2_GEOKU|nr:hypothetical protein GBL_0673 [Geobacillus kaustophilus GBlys]
MIWLNTSFSAFSLEQERRRANDICPQSVHCSRGHAAACPVGKRAACRLRQKSSD